MASILINAEFLLLSGNLDPEPCPKGFYCEEGISPYPCPPRTYNNITGAHELSQCLDCPAGLYNITHSLQIQII